MSTKLVENLKEKVETLKEKAQVVEVAEATKPKLGKKAKVGIALTVIGGVAAAIIGGVAISKKNSESDELVVDADEYSVCDSDEADWTEF